MCITLFILLWVQPKLQWEFSCSFLVSLPQNWLGKLNINLFKLSSILITVSMTIITYFSLHVFLTSFSCSWFIRDSHVIHTWFNLSSCLIILFLVKCWRTFEKSRMVINLRVKTCLGKCDKVHLISLHHLGFIS